MSTAELDRFEETVHAQLNSLQHGINDRVIFFRQLPIGLGGQIIGRLDALRLALALDRKVVFRHDNDPPYTQTFKSTFSNYCLPEELPEIPHLDLNIDQSEELTVQYGPDMFPIRKGMALEITIRAIGNRLDMSFTEGLLDAALYSWLQPTNTAEAYASNSIHRFGIDRSTLGVHFRRGDKKVESAYVPVSVYQSEIDKLLLLGKFKSVFVASDSPDALSELKFPKEIKVIFDVDEKRYNNANHKMLMRNPDIAEQETLTAYKNIRMLSSCGGIVGQDNAHFAKLAALSQASAHIDQKLQILIDGRISEKSSTWVSIKFTAVRKLRSLAKKLFPSMTVSSHQTSILRAAGRKEKMRSIDGSKRR